MNKTFRATFRDGARLVQVDADPGEVFGSVSLNPGILSRNGVRYLRCRSWRADAKRADLAAFKRAKAELAQEFVGALADDMAALLLECFGVGFFRSVAPVACGHSRRPDCLSVRLAVAVAERIGGNFVRAFGHRFVSGSSHPKEFAKLPPLIVETLPEGPALIVDDVATSGFHMHEAVTALRAKGVPTFGAVWVSGVKQ